MSRTKRILLIILASMAAIFLLTFVLAAIYKDEVRTLVVKSLNQNLKSEIKVQEINFSFIRHFPYASVEFENLKAQEPKNFITTGTILTAEKITLLFNIAGIFNKDYKLKKIVLENASLNLQVDKEGNANYEIWKSDSSDAGNSQLKLELEKVEMKNVNVLYYNVAKKQDIAFLIKEGNLSGDFSNDKYTLTSSTTLENASVKVDEVTYLPGTDCSLQLQLDVDKPKGSYTFHESRLLLAGLDLGIAGNIVDRDDYLDLNLDVSSPKSNLKALLSLIPEKYTANTSGYNYDGDVEFKSSFTGRSDKTNSPLVTISFKTNNASLNPKGTPYHLTRMNVSGLFTNRKNKVRPVTYLRLDHFNALLEGKPVSADFEIENFNQPTVNASAKMEVDLKVLSRFYKPDTLEDISGNLFVDASFKGVAGLKSTYRSSGDLKFSNVSFRLKQKPTLFTGFNGMAHLDGNDLVVESFSGHTGSSDFSLNGTFYNLFSWILLDGQQLDIQAQLVSSNINLDELLAKDAASSARDTVYRLSLSNKLTFRLGLNVLQLHFRNFNASSLTGDIAMENKVLATHTLDFETVGGNVKLKGQIDDRTPDSLKIDYDAQVTNLDINRLFTEMGNFGQQVIVDKNLKGRVTADVQFRSTWTDKLVVDEDKIYAKSDVTIENGELINFDPMLALSRFLKGSDLKTIKFSTITNTIEIKNRKIYIPLMEIKSSAMDLTASGIHGFDNIVDYKLRLYLSQLMGKKVRAQNTEFGTIEDDGLGRPMVFLTMKGPANDPKFAWDRNAVEKKITTEIKNESKTLKQLLKDEFGKKDTTVKKNTPKKQDELQIDYGDDDSGNK